MCCPGVAPRANASVESSAIEGLRLESNRFAGVFCACGCLPQRHTLDPWSLLQSRQDHVPAPCLRAPGNGQPCFEGTSTPIDVLFVNLAAGERLDVILDRKRPSPCCARASVWFAKGRMVDA